MKAKKLPLLILITLFIFTSSLSGCTVIDELKIKTGMKNTDFEYIKEKKVDRIVIQSTRDKGFRFLVNDTDVIKDIYDILSKAKKVTEKTDLDPDYIFEIHMGDEVKSFYYVTGFNENKEGNFYDDNNIYKISTRLDNDIIQNLSFIRKPREFKNIYYDSTLTALSEHKDLLNQGNKKVGIDILGDIDCAKYLLSVEIEDFKRRLKEIIPNSEIMNHNREDFDIIVSVRNYGYKTTTYKTIIKIENKQDHSENKFYVDGKYNNSWNIEVFDKMPDSWK
ncbi:hypothetical protein [Clostridium tarantellae]|uniref:YhfM-like domain-containing protein n=1 Tax=Clostridium tarantellae TaxID=39493 RepID=A0A6I1MH96_9CLOT|nr:hypothetical protein [Clostridium tarantellae]MPQ42204.1 hypothetical protein [Clostridium tarantellae]